MLFLMVGGGGSRFSCSGSFCSCGGCSCLYSVPSLPLPVVVFTDVFAGVAALRCCRSSYSSCSSHS